MSGELLHTLASGSVAPLVGSDSTAVDIVPADVMVNTMIASVVYAIHQHNNRSQSLSQPFSLKPTKLSTAAVTAAGGVSGVDKKADSKATKAGASVPSEFGMNGVFIVNAVTNPSVSIAQLLHSCSP